MVSVQYKEVSVYKRSLLNNLSQIKRFQMNQAHPDSFKTVT